MATTTVNGANAEARAQLRRRALVLAWLTVGWNTIEALVAIVAGTVADSLALVSFGLDAVIEVASAAVVIWQFLGADRDREQRALRLISISFFALAAYVTAHAAVDLIAAHEPDFSPIGLLVALVSLAVMPLLAKAKRATASQLGSATVAADSQQTMLCTYLSAVVVVGLSLNALFGWWWADSVAALFVAALAVREGRETWNGQSCCA